MGNELLVDGTAVELVGGKVVEGAVQPERVVEAFDVPHGLLSGVVEVG
jgi:hypothetical protein